MREDHCGGKGMLKPGGGCSYVSVWCIVDGFAEEYDWKGGSSVDQLEANRYQSISGEK